MSAKEKPRWSGASPYKMAVAAGCCLAECKPAVEPVAQDRASSAAGALGAGGGLAGLFGGSGGLGGLADLLNLGSGLLGSGGGKGLMSELDLKALLQLQQQFAQARQALLLQQNQQNSFSEPRTSFTQLLGGRF